MVANNETFKERLQGLKQFFAKRRLLAELGRRVGARERTVSYTFAVKSDNNLTGKRLLVYSEAVRWRKELEDIAISNMKGATAYTLNKEEVTILEIEIKDRKIFTTKGDYRFGDLFVDGESVLSRLS